MPQVRAHDPGGALGPERDRSSTLVLERVHLLRHDVGGVAGGARVQLRVLEGRRLQVSEPEQTRGRVRRVVQRQQLVGVVEQEILGAAGRLERHQPNSRRYGLVARSRPTVVSGP